MQRSEVDLYLLDFNSLMRIKYIEVLKSYHYGPKEF